jgi:hypothetical protein
MKALIKENTKTLALAILTIPVRYQLQKFEKERALPTRINW